jgi:HlyD family secretion protein
LYMKSWLSWLLVFIGLALAVAIGYSFWPKPQEVDLVTVERGSISVSVDEDGKTRIREKYVVSAPLSGRLMRIGMDAGDPVVAGETLIASIEPRDPELLDARAIAQAEARVSAAQSALSRTEPQLEQARIEQANAERYMNRVREAPDAFTESDLDNVQAQYRAASEQLRMAKYAQEIARFELEQAQAALIRSRPREENSQEPTDANGWTFTIRSPITGRVLRVLQESSAVVTPGTPLVELGDPSDLEVEIDVLSSDAVKINAGDPVVFEHWGGGEPLHGLVRLVEPSGFTKISTLGVEEQRVYVIVDLVDPLEKRQALGDGFRVEARIIVDQADDVLTVPSSSLFRVGDEWALFVVREGRAYQTIVQLGRQNGLASEIVDGVKEGATVVLHPSDKITDAVRVMSR